MRDSLTVKIVGKRQENSEVATLYMERPFDFVAGQYISVYVPDSKVREGKAYSLSSRPSDKLLSITVKDVGGEFSSYICSRKVGDELMISRAYGNFNPLTDKPLVGITAGCGLSPIWSVMTDEASTQSKTLFFSHKTPKYTVFDQELEQSDIDEYHFSTREVVNDRENWQSGRFEVAKIVEQTADDAHFLVCGGIGFVRDVWQKLTACGVSDEQISTETFFES